MNSSQTSAPRPLQVGDRVRVVKDSLNKSNVGKFGVITDLRNDGVVGIRLDGQSYSEYCHNGLLERVEPYDRKRDFLERLQSLLREFDASIVGGQDEYSHDDFVKISFKDIKSEMIYRNGDVATFASINHLNIMDYEKE